MGFGGGSWVGGLSWGWGYVMKCYHRGGGKLPLRGLGPMGVEPCHGVGEGV